MSLETLLEVLEDMDTKARQKRAAYDVHCRMENVRAIVFEDIQVNAGRATLAIHSMAHAARLSLGQKHRRRMERSK